MKNLKCVFGIKFKITSFGYLIQPGSSKLKKPLDQFNKLTNKKLVVYTENLNHILTIEDYVIDSNEFDLETIQDIVDNYNQENITQDSKDFLGLLEKSDMEALFIPYLGDCERSYNLTNEVEEKYRNYNVETNSTPKIYVGHFL